MDTNMEDRMLHQIQTNLSNSIDENLFSTGRTFEVNHAANKGLPMDSMGRGDTSIGEKETAFEAMESTYPSTKLTRAEYIRQAREACLKQLGTVPQGARNMEHVQEANDQNAPLLPSKKKNRLIKLFPEVSDEDTQKEAASFNSLIIRTVCCVVIFLSIFVIDKLKVEWGEFSHLTVREFITGNDKLSALEEIIISWLK